MTGPRSVARRVVRAVVRGGLRIPPVRRAVKAELAAASSPAQVQSPQATGARELPAVFVDANGIEHQLDPTLRDRLKPSWRVMCDPVAVAAPPSDEELRRRARKAATSVTEMERTLGVVAGASLTGWVLEIGCFDGAVAFEIARRPGTQVLGSDLARYYVTQRPGQPEDAAVAAQQETLASLRERARDVAGAAPGAVDFIEDDITASSLEPASFDIIASFEVLEHVQRPPAAFASMARLLRPGGLLYHDYNPFFSINGGHSLVTLDLPWGHTRLAAPDVERYLREIRPSEAEQALRFYRESLNRMTLADLRAVVARANLELLAVVPWFDRALLPGLPARALDEVRRNYPTATIEDLLGTFVTVVARRPMSAG
jgi:SAM-dependent methyltransferase